jgi:hypothetical protein
LGYAWANWAGQKGRRMRSPHGKGKKKQAGLVEWAKMEEGGEPEISPFSFFFFRVFQIQFQKNFEILFKFGQIHTIQTNNAPACLQHYIFKLIIDFNIQQKLLFSKFKCHRIAYINQVHQFLESLKFLGVTIILLV